MKKQHWIDFVEYLSLIGLGAGSVLSIVSKQMLYTSAPLSFALLIGFANRRRVEQAQEQAMLESLVNLEQRLSKNIHLIDQQVQGLPTPEMIGDVRQSILRHNRDELKRLGSHIHEVKREIEQRLDQIDQQNLSAIPDEIENLRSQYTELYTTLAEVSTSLSKFVTSARADDIDQTIASLTSETGQLQATVQTLNEYSKHTLSNLQDQLTQMNRQIKSLPPQVDTSSIKREVSELVRVVADLVPKRELNTVMADIQAIQQQQEAQLQIDEALRQDLQLVNQRLQAIPDVPQLRSQLEDSFAQEIRALNRQLKTLPVSPEFRRRVEEVLRDQWAVVQAQWTTLHKQLAERLSETPYDLIVDLSIEQDAQEPGQEPSKETVAIAGSRRVFEEALETTQERLILIWPWSQYMELDAPLMRQIEQVLRQQRRIDVGWCHITHRDEERFFSIINRRWSINPLKREALQGTLKRLLAFKRRYPDHFRFKVLGTVENFLVSDSKFAVLGIQEQLKTRTVLNRLDLKLRTTEPVVIQQLIDRFDEADPPAHDIEAYWNRAVTRYDLGDKTGAIADLNAILAAMPDDATVYNLRGIIRYERQDVAGAFEDLSESIALNPNQSAAYCNRGYLRSEGGDQYGAIADFSLAIQTQPQSAIAFFYRGAASQKLEDHEGAVADYTQALNYAPNTPFIHYQRGMAYQDLGQLEAAVFDLEKAFELFYAAGNLTNAETVRSHLSSARLAMQRLTTSMMINPSARRGEVKHEVLADLTEDGAEIFNSTLDTLPIEPPPLSADMATTASSSEDEPTADLAAYWAEVKKDMAPVEETVAFKSDEIWAEQGNEPEDELASDDLIPEEKVTDEPLGVEAIAPTEAFGDFDAALPENAFVEKEPEADSASLPEEESYSESQDQNFLTWTMDEEQRESTPATVADAVLASDPVSTVRPDTIRPDTEDTGLAPLQHSETIDDLFDELPAEELDWTVDSTPHSMDNPMDDSMDALIEPSLYESDELLDQELAESVNELAHAWMNELANELAPLEDPWVESTEVEGLQSPTEPAQDSETLAAPELNGISASPVNLDDDLDDPLELPSAPAAAPFPDSETDSDDLFSGTETLETFFSTDLFANRGTLGEANPMDWEDEPIFRLSSAEGDWAPPMLRQRPSLNLDAEPLSNHDQAQPDRAIATSSNHSLSQPPQANSLEETAMDQIGTQTLADFFSIIHADAEGPAAPSPRTQGFNSAGANDQHGDSDEGQAQVPQVLDDLFWGAPAETNLGLEPEQLRRREHPGKNGTTTNNAPPEESPELPSGGSAEATGESLSDFCERFL